MWARLDILPTADGRAVARFQVFRDQEHYGQHYPPVVTPGPRAPEPALLSLSLSVPPGELERWAARALPGVVFQDLPGDLTIVGPERTYTKGEFQAALSRMRAPRVVDLPGDGPVPFGSRESAVRDIDALEVPK